MLVEGAFFLEVIVPMFLLGGIPVGSVSGGAPCQVEGYVVAVGKIETSTGRQSEIRWSCSGDGGVSGVVIICLGGCVGVRSFKIRNCYLGSAGV